MPSGYGYGYGLVHEAWHRHPTRHARETGPPRDTIRATEPSRTASPHPGFQDSLKQPADPVSGNTARKSRFTRNAFRNFARNPLCMGHKWQQTARKKTAWCTCGRKGKETPPPQGVVEKDRKKPGWRNRSKCCVKNTPAEAGQYPGKSISGPDLVCRYHRKYRQLYQKSGKNRNVPAASRHERHQHPEKAGIKKHNKNNILQIHYVH